VHALDIFLLLLYIETQDNVSLYGSNIKRMIGDCFTGRKPWEPVALAGFCATLGRKNHDKLAPLGVCKAKNHLIGDFGGFMREAQQTPGQSWPNRSGGKHEH
jgi:hypothetical protein